MNSPPCFTPRSGPADNSRAERLYRALTLVAMLLILASLWAF